ncbi:2-oxo-4-hydroxy-4-carboxy-5-ureidoimidazoline decarboxylase [Nocardia sp. NPDC004068]|uniref:2-oxo-4-hydroxy-4-carboxy-5-ureidoimidazoline decarboxylase n=1 Tax=Nocardia sp. NPDC004068 TaxID=3364303 RepID=UPI00369363D3
MTAPEALMSLYQGLGLDAFNELPRARAVHTLYACCCAVTWAEKVADGRPYPTRETLYTAVEVELRALSPADRDRMFDSLAREPVSNRSVAELARITRIRLDRVLGPVEGYPEY